MSDEKLKDLEARVRALEGYSTEREALEAQIVEAGKQWARLTMLNFYIDDQGYRVLVCESDARMYAEDFMKTIQRHSLALVRMAAS